MIKKLISNSLKSKKIIFFASLATLSVLFSLSSNYFMRSTDAYKYTIKKINESEKISEALGDIKSIKSRSFNITAQLDNPLSKANFELVVSGTKRSATVLIGLEKDVIHWRVVKAKLRGRNIDELLD